MVGARVFGFDALLASFVVASGRALPCHEHADGGLLTLCLLPEPGLEVFDPVEQVWFDVCTDKRSGASFVVSFCHEKS
jgi:hypothetical protein